jgi:hypothetical protein
MADPASTLGCGAGILIATAEISSLVIDASFHHLFHILA